MLFPTVINIKQFRWFIIISSVIAFFPVFTADFMFYDDPEYLLNNSYVKTISWNNIRDIFIGKATILYVPLTSISYMLEYAVYELNPLGYHLVNLTLHILNSILLFSLLQKLNIKNVTLIYVSVIMFTLHPMVCESVCWITERKDVLYCFFYFLSANYFVTFLSKKNAKTWLLCFMFFVLACFSKPMAINLPVLMALYLIYLDKRIDMKKMIFIIPFVLVSAIFAYVSVVSIKNGATGKINISDYGVGEKLFLFVSEIGYYFFRPFYPLGNRLFHFFPKAESLFNNFTLVVYFALTLMLFGAVFFAYVRKRNRDLLFIFAAWLVILLPILQIYPNTHSYVSERYFYVSIIFPVIVLIKLIWPDPEEIPIKGNPRFYLQALSLLLIITAFVRSNTWKNTENLMLNELKYDSRNAMALNNLGYYYNQKNEFKKAEEKLRIAVSLDTTNAFYLNNYGWALGGSGQIDSAIYYFKKAYLHKHNYFDALNNLAVSCSMKDNFKDAGLYFSKAEAIQPQHPELLYNLGAFYLKQGDKSKAKRYFVKALEKGNKKAYKYLNI